MNKIDLRNTKKIIYNGDNINKIYVGNVLAYKNVEDSLIEYTVQDVNRIDYSLPKGVPIINKKITGNKVKLRVGEGNITFSGNSEIIAIERLKHKQLSSCETMFQSVGSSSRYLEVDFTEFNTENVTDFYKMFAFCKNLDKLIIPGINTKNATDLSYMFYNCSSLKELDLSNFNTSNVTKMNSLFTGCTSLKMLDIRNFDTRKVKGYSLMFQKVPADCKIYVGENWTLSEKVTWFEGKFIRV